MKILIADDHEIVRKGLRQILLDQYPHATIEDASDGEILVKKALESDWNIIISDISMPFLNGLEALLQIKKVKPGVPILMLSIHSGDQYALRAMKSGAHGYLTKDLAQQELVNAVERVLSGKKFISSKLAEEMVHSLKSDMSAISHENLSNREFHVFKLLASGDSISDIATFLNLNVSTISTYRTRILEKMRMKSNADITRYALEKKLI